MENEANVYQYFQQWVTCEQALTEIGETYYVQMRYAGNIQVTQEDIDNGGNTEKDNPVALALRRALGDKAELRGVWETGFEVDWKDGEIGEYNNRGPVSLFMQKWNEFGSSKVKPTELLMVFGDFDDFGYE